MASQDRFLSSAPVRDDGFIPDRVVQSLFPNDSPRRARPGRRQIAWFWLPFAAIIGLAAFLNFFQLQQNGYGNMYYAAAVKSMLMNWHNFFFVSFDPGGFVTVDKPPVALWLQTLCAKCFGFSGFSLMLPQALAGVLAVGVLFYLVRRSFGHLPALVAALSMAITPVAVVISRDNNLDMLLVLVVLLATWAVQRASETGSLKWLLSGAVLLGVGFNVKMFEAYLVVPALGLLYLVASPRSWWWRAAHLALALVVLLVVSFSWIMAVDLTPASQRPYVGSTQTNSELELALNYNGIARLFHLGGTAVVPGRSTQMLSTGALSFWRAGFGSPQKGSPAQPAPNSPGPWRLFTQPLAGLIGWLLPLALLSMVALAWQSRWRGPPDAYQRALLLWGTWLLAMLIAFSIAVHFLTYYTVMMAPAISALTGIGLFTLWRDYHIRAQGRWRGWLLPLALLITGSFQIALLTPYPGWSAWLSPLILVLTLLAGAVFVAVRVPARRGRIYARLARIAVVVGSLAILAAPFVWSATPLTYPANGSSPGAGPRQPNLAAVFQERFPSSSTYRLDSRQRHLLRYLLAHRGTTPFLLGTLDASTAIPFILVAGQPVMALGGFSSSDPILTPARLATEIEEGSVRFFLLPFTVQISGSTMRLVPRGGNGALVHWIATSCTFVPPRQWDAGSVNALPDQPGQLYRNSEHPQHLSNGAVTTVLYDCGDI